MDWKIGGNERKKVVGSGIIAVLCQEQQQSRSWSAMSVLRAGTISSRATASCDDVQTNCIWASVSRGDVDDVESCCSRARKNQQKNSTFGFLSLSLLGEAVSVESLCI